MKSTTNPLEKIAIDMIATFDKAGISGYARTLCSDIQDINDAGADGFVWVLRKNGTVIAPIKQGFDSRDITFWLSEDASNQAFFIDTNPMASASIKPITHAEAAELICLMPCELSPTQSASALKADVNNALSTWDHAISFSDMGCSSHWKRFLDYFTASGNRVMCQFVNRAMELDRSA